MKRNPALIRTKSNSFSPDDRSSALFFLSLTDHASERIRLFSHILFLHRFGNPADHHAEAPPDGYPAGNPGSERAHWVRPISFRQVFKTDKRIVINSFLLKLRININCKIPLLLRTFPRQTIYGMARCGLSYMHGRSAQG
jgi:hypothetical protein